jgi:ADP-ribose pyrophosphatase YjhB (NUDIX family)
MTFNARENSGTDQVACDIEVVFFNLSPVRGLIAGGVRRRDDGLIDFLTGQPEPREHPSETALRLLRDRAGIDTSVHDPALVRVGPYEDQQPNRPTVTLTYAVLGRRPGYEREPWVDHVAVDEPGRRPFAHEATLQMARVTLIRLMRTDPIALSLLEHPSEPFRLEDLYRIYSTVLGPERQLDVSNFRRSVRRSVGLAQRVPSPATGDSVNRRGRPAHWFVDPGVGAISPPLSLPID